MVKRENKGEVLLDSEGEKQPMRRMSIAVVVMVGLVSHISSGGRLKGEKKMV